MRQAVNKSDTGFFMTTLKLAKILYWRIRDAFKVLWVTLLLAGVRVWKTPRRTNRKIQPGEKLKICIISEYYYPTLGGITEHVYNLAKNLLRKGHQVTLITSNAGDPGGRGELEGLKICRVGKSMEIYSNGSIAKMTFGWRIHKEVKKIFDENYFDIVHIQSAMVPTLPLLCQKYAASTVIGTFHTDFDKNFALGFWSKAAQHNLDQFDKLIAVSPNAITSVQRYLDGKGKFRVISNGVDTEWYYPRKNTIEALDDGRPNILYIGRFDPRNGFSTVVKAFDILKKDIPAARLVVIAYGPLQGYYLSKIPPYLMKDIVFVGKKDLTRPQYYSSCHVMCIPAKKATCSIITLETLASGVPVVASSIDGLKKILDHEEDALLVEGFKPQSFADAIKRILTDKTLADKLSKNALIKAQAYDWKPVSDKIVGLYYEALKAKPAETSAEEALEEEQQGDDILIRPYKEIPLQLN